MTSGALVPEEWDHETDVVVTSERGPQVFPLH